MRLCIAIDVEKYSRFGNPDAEHAQERFVHALRYARNRAGLSAADVSIDRSGDGQFLVLPPGLDESSAIPAFVTGLSVAMRRTNERSSRHFRLRLRVAMHRGLLKPGINGWVGHAAIAVHRLLDSTSLRTALRRTPTATFALAVSDSLYRDVVAHGYPGLASASFHRTVVNIRHKAFREPAWIYLDEEPATPANRYALLAPSPRHRHLP
ncbi:hypothetical protein [Actinophytocola sp. NPDC049390]|uniref:hypothetical protein n=1 Tax=Actinophytocola sp. NPDC049390 TaxID=3363894 RepID=UPI0037BCA105